MTRPMSVELDLTRKPAAPAVANLAGQNLAGLGREGLRQALIGAGVESRVKPATVPVSGTG